MSEPVARPAFVPGLFSTMPAEQYHAIEAMSSGGIKKMLQSPLHYKLMRDTPNEPTPAMQFGTAVHAGALEPYTFSERVVAAPEVNKRTKDGKAEWDAFAAANAGKVVLSADDYARALRCIEAVGNHPGAMRLLHGSRREVSLFWIDDTYKVPCKVRLDVWNFGGIVDLKTTQDASPEAFGRTIASFMYHVQGAHYSKGAEQVLGEWPEFFAFIAVESEPPHAVACYTLPANAVLVGAKLRAEALARYAEALRTGVFRGYPDTVDVIQLPAWAMRSF